MGIFHPLGLLEEMHGGRGRESRNSYGSKTSKVNLGKETLPQMVSFSSLIFNLMFYMTTIQKTKGLTM